MDTPDTPALSVRDRLAASRKARADLRHGKLPICSVGFTYPGHISHNAALTASRIAGKKHSSNVVLCTQVCLFEGERLTVDEVAAMDFRDLNHLISCVLGEDDGETGSEQAEDGSGN